MVPSTLSSWPTLIKHVVLVCFVIISNSLYASTDEEAILNQSGKSFDYLNKEIKALTDSVVNATGEDKQALQLQLFLKNKELRSDIAIAIDKRTYPEDKLLELVNNQIDYTDQNLELLEQQIIAINESMSEGSSEVKLSLASNVRELHKFLLLTYESIYQNLNWLSELGVDTASNLTDLRSKISNRLRLFSASIEFLNQQSRNLGSQFSLSSEISSSTLELEQLVVKQRLDLMTKSLHSLILIGDELSIETTEYKRQVFEVTGNFSYQLLDFLVVLSILQDLLGDMINWLIENAPQIVFQLLIFALILLVANTFAKLVRRIVHKAVSSKSLHLSQLMKEFFISMSGKVMWVIGLMVGLSQIGLDLTPILTGFGIAGLVIGFALQDTLSNFAAGMMLLIYRPFDVGDFVFAGGVDGKVSHMSLVSTTIRTFDNQVIIVPNSNIWGGVIKNVTHERVRRVDMIFGIGYQDDLLKAESVLKDITESHALVLNTPEPTIKVHTLNTSSVDFIVRPWVKTDDYWDVYWDITKEVKLRFDREGISIPFPQQDVHLHMTEQIKT